MSSGAPFLSLVVTGRNDDFGGDFTRRFFRALRFNHRQLTDAGVDVECVLVEWRPVPGRPWLATLLAEAFPDLAGRSVFSYVVDARYHEALSLNPRLEFREFLAENVGIRRARAPFVLATHSDAYLGGRAVDLIASRAVQPKTLYRATRIDVSPDAAADGAEDPTRLEDPRYHLHVYESRPPLFTYGAGDFQLMDAASWALVRGFNEVYRRARIHMDTNLCHKVRSMGLSIVHSGATVYHVGTGTITGESDQYAAHPELAPWGDAGWHKRVVYENPTDWGLADAPVRQVAEHTTVIDFDWRAVAPLVDLRRLALPASRLSTPAVGGAS